MSMLKLIYCDGFRHEGPIKEEITDFIRFSQPVIIKKWRIIRKGGVTHPTHYVVGYEL